MTLQYEQMKQIRTMCSSPLNEKTKKTKKQSSKTRAEKKEKSRVEESYFDKGAGDADESPFQIEVRFLGGLSNSQQAVFQQAADRWAEIIVSDLPSAQLPNGEVIDSLMIEAQGVEIDGVNGILGRAGPRFLRPDTLIPVTGVMQFDTADLANMEDNGSLQDVIVHEMGHVIGIGTIWSDKQLLVGCGNPPAANPVFMGENAIREFAELIGGNERPVPVANTGGAGTRCGHWRESVLGNELMTGFLDVGSNPLSRLTIASLDDLGYDVDYLAADPFNLPTQLELALMGIGAESHRQTCRMCGGGVKPITPVVLPESSLQ